MTFGPQIDGRRTLVLVSDNNFSGQQFTQFLAFSVVEAVPAPSSSLLLFVGLALPGALALARWRRPARPA